MLPTLKNDVTQEQGILTVALELSQKCWKLACQDGRHEKPSIHNARHEMASMRLREVVELIGKQKDKWDLPENCRVVVMYEAGQDGFWLYRALKKLGYEALIIDAASIPVERQSRRRKTDRLDAIKLVNALLAYLRGERDRMHPIHIPAEAAEEQRQLVRERGTLQKEIQQHRDRMRKLLRTVGCWQPIGRDFAKQLSEGKICCHDETALPEQLQQRLLSECERMTLAEKQMAALEATLKDQMPVSVKERLFQLQKLKGVGEVGATRLVLELFWRQFRNRREVGSCVGLVPQPFDSGESHVDQGISKQGNRRVRALLVEMAWMWLRYQPESVISRWFAQRTCGTETNKRNKRIAIVAVARRLVIALWRYVEEGIVPEGARMKAG